MAFVEKDVLEKAALDTIAADLNQALNDVSNATTNANDSAVNANNQLGIITFPRDGSGDLKLVPSSGNPSTGDISYYFPSGEIFQLTEWNGNAWIDFGFPLPAKQLYDVVRAEVDQLTIDLNAVEEGQTTGVIGYTDKATMDADTTQTNNTVGFVMNDATAANNGWYRYDGTSWIKRAEFNATVLDPVDTSEAVTGKAVGDYVYRANRVKEMVTGEDFAISNITFSVNGNIKTATLLWADGEAGSISNLVEDGEGRITSLRYNRPASKYITIDITYDGTGNVSTTTLTATGY